MVPRLRDSLALASSGRGSAIHTTQGPFPSPKTRDTKDAFSALFIASKPPIMNFIPQEKDAKLVCSWLAVSFGVSDAKYHWAYSREMIRQAKRAAKGLTTIEGVINSKDDVEPVWF